MLNNSAYQDRYFFDITDMLEFARDNCNTTLTGIQRFSLRVIGHLLKQHGAEKIKLIAYHPIVKRVVEIDSSFLEADYSFNQAQFCQSCGLNTDFILKNYLRNKYKGTYKRRFHRFRLKFLNCITKGKAFKRRGIGIEGSSRRVRDVTLLKNDTVILMGATWNGPSIIDYLKNNKTFTNCRVIAFIHDLIPLVAAEHVGDGVSTQFYYWLLSIANIADQFLVNSQCTKEDLNNYLKQHAINKKITIVPLAHEFITESNISTVPIQLDLLSQAKSHYLEKCRIPARILNATHFPYVLCVGTIESRKNIWSLLNVWKVMLDEIGPGIPRLILAGKLGWGMENVQNFLKGTCNLNGHISICERPQDFELAYLYENCLFTVFPSYYEGWGLPVGESLWFGKFVVASDRSSTPEVGKYMVDYANPYCFQSLYKAIKQPIVDQEYLKLRTKQINLSHLRTWTTVSNDFWKSISNENTQKNISTYKLEVSKAMNA